MLLNEDMENAINVADDVIAVIRNFNQRFFGAKLNQKLKKLCCTAYIKDDYIIIDYIGNNFVVPVLFLPVNQGLNGTQVNANAIVAQIKEVKKLNIMLLNGCKEKEC